MYNKDKIFVIGFNKSGTSSIAKFFAQCNIPTIHHDSGKIAETMRSNMRTGEKLLTGYPDYTVYADIENVIHATEQDKEPFFGYEHFDKLYKQYPESKFILNYRDINDWLLSRCRHGLNEAFFSGQRKSYLNQFVKYYDTDVYSIIQMWQEHYHTHIKNVRTFFSKPGRESRLLELDMDVSNDKLTNHLHEFFTDMDLPNQVKLPTVHKTR